MFCCKHMVYIRQVTCSICSDMVYIRQIVLKSGWATLADKALNLSKLIDKQMWSVQTPLRQFPSILKEIPWSFQLSPSSATSSVGNTHSGFQGVDIANFEARMQAMTKPMYTAITQHAKSGTLVFVLTGKHARLTSLDLCAYSSAEGSGTPFLLGSVDEMDTFTKGVNEETLKNTLKCGVGYLREGLTDLDQELVTQLFLCGRILSVRREQNNVLGKIIACSFSCCDGNPIL